MGRRRRIVDQMREIMKRKQDGEMKESGEDRMRMRRAESRNRRRVVKINRKKAARKKDVIGRKRKRHEAESSGR